MSVCFCCVSFHFRFHITSFSPLICPSNAQLAVPSLIRDYCVWNAPDTFAANMHSRHAKATRSHCTWNFYFEYRNASTRTVNNLSNCMRESLVIFQNVQVEWEENIKIILIFGIDDIFTWMRAVQCMNHIEAAQNSPNRDTQNVWWSMITMIFPFSSGIWGRGCLCAQQKYKHNESCCEPLILHSLNVFSLARTVFRVLR